MDILPKIYYQNDYFFFKSNSIKNCYENQKKFNVIVITFL